MTGDELTATLLRHGIEVLGIEESTEYASQRLWRILARDVAGAGDLEALLPHNVEMTLQRREMTHFIGNNPFGPIGRSGGEIREVRVRGRNPDALTSPPPTARQWSAMVMDVRRVPRSQGPSTPVPRVPRTVVELNRATARAQREQIASGSGDFRADLWRRMCEHYGRTPIGAATLVQTRSIESDGLLFAQASYWPGQPDPSIFRRWSVYQALKPLYDVVDGVEGATSAAMPRDVSLELASRVGLIEPQNFADAGWSLERRSGQLVVTRATATWTGDSGPFAHAIQQMPSVLDAVAFARVAAAETSQPQSPQQPILNRNNDLIVPEDVILPDTSAVPPTLTLDTLTASLPRLFPDGEPRVTGVKRASGRDGVFTVSVQLEKVAGSTVSASAVASSLPSNVILAVTTQARAVREFRGTGSSRLEAPPQRRAAKPAAVAPPPPPPTRFNLLDLDDGPVVKPTVQSTLKRDTKPPTAAQVRKFRDAFEGRSAVSAAECAKVANFGDDEAAQHLLVSHCGGLSDDEAAAMLAKAHQELFVVTLPSVDAWARHHRQQRAATLEPDPSADPSATVAAWREEQQRRRARAAELRSKTVRRVVEAAVPRTRWDLLELDGAVLPPAEELRVKPAPRYASRPVTPPPWQPPAPPVQHIDVPLPEPTVDYVDVSMLPQELHGVVVTSCLLDEATKIHGGARAN